MKLDSVWFEHTISFPVILYAYVIKKSGSKTFLEHLVNPNWNEAFSTPPFHPAE